jgi:hypothetical protein
MRTVARATLAVLAVLALASRLDAAPDAASDAFQWSGFALARGTSGSEAAPFQEHGLTAQIQLGLDWRPSVFFGTHVHLLARDDDGRAKRGHAGVVEAYAEWNVHRPHSRLRILGGAFFLPTSRENIDELWATPYTITSSALNTWLGEELRPIGVDAAYTWRRSLTVGGTLFRGNDTFGGFPAGRGWVLGDRWTLLGEHVPANADYYSSVSAENDHRLGWSARARWNNDHATVQLTRIDNRGDALEHGELLNWETPFTIAGADYTLGDWTFAGEYGWGQTIVEFDGTRFPTKLDATYVLVSRRFASSRATLRADDFRAATRTRAITAAWFWMPPGKLRLGFEATVAGGKKRAMAEVRYHFSAR